MKGESVRDLPSTHWPRRLPCCGAVRCLTPFPAHFRSDARNRLTRAIRDDGMKSDATSKHGELSASAPAGHGLLASAVTLAGKRSHRHLRTLGWLATACVSVALSSCAITREREDGSREVTGFVRLLLPPQDGENARAGHTLDVETVGILVYSSPLGSGVSLGYSREQLTGLRNNVVVGPIERGSKSVGVETNPVGTRSQELTIEKDAR